MNAVEPPPGPPDTGDVPHRAGVPALPRPARPQDTPRVLVLAMAPPAYEGLLRTLHPRHGSRGTTGRYRHHHG